MASIISVCNLKGGSGKSTIAVNLACSLGNGGGKEVVLVDADRQGTAVEWGRKGRLPVPVIAKVLLEAKPEDRYPGILWVSQLKALAGGYRYVLVDLPPGLEYSMAAVAAVSDLILVPVNPSGIDFHATTRFLDLIIKSRELRGGGEPRCLIVPNRIDGRTRYARDITPYAAFGEPIAPAIAMRSSFARAFSTGMWIGDFAPDSAGHQEIRTLAELVCA